MKEKSNSSASGGIGFTGLLAVAFIVLKLTGVINWSWWWVLSPLWLPIVILLVIAAVAFLVILAGHVIADWRMKRHYRK